MYIRNYIIPAGVQLLGIVLATARKSVNKSFKKVFPRNKMRNVMDS